MDTPYIPFGDKVVFTRPKHVGFCAQVLHIDRKEWRLAIDAAPMGAERVQWPEKVSIRLGLGEMAMLCGLCQFKIGKAQFAYRQSYLMLIAQRSDNQLLRLQFIENGQKRFYIELQPHECIELGWIAQTALCKAAKLTPLEIGPFLSAHLPSAF